MPVFFGSGHHRVVLYCACTANEMRCPRPIRWVVPHTELVSYWRTMSCLDDGDGAGAFCASLRDVTETTEQNLFGRSYRKAQWKGGAMEILSAGISVPSRPVNVALANGAAARSLRLRLVRQAARQWPPAQWDKETSLITFNSSAVSLCSLALSPRGPEQVPFDAILVTAAASHPAGAGRTAQAWWPHGDPGRRAV